jgi:hypothetical protein
VLVDKRSHTSTAAIARSYREVGLNVSVGRVPLVIFYEQQMLSPLDASSIDESRDVGTAVADDRRPGRRRLSLENLGARITDGQTNSVWDISGLAVSRPLRGKELQPVLQNSQFWFALAAFLPQVPLPALDSATRLVACERAVRRIRLTQPSERSARADIS